MSLNCKGLRARNGKSKKGKAHASTLACRSMLAKIVNQHKPQVLALQETWHLPHDDSIQVEGYCGIMGVDELLLMVSVLRPAEWVFWY